MKRANSLSIFSAFVYLLMSVSGLYCMYTQDQYIKLPLWLRQASGTSEGSGSRIEMHFEGHKAPLSRNPKLAHKKQNLEIR